MLTAPYTSVFWVFFASSDTNWLILFILKLKCYVTELVEEPKGSDSATEKEVNNSLCPKCIHYIRHKT